MSQHCSVRLRFLFGVCVCVSVCDRFRHTNYIRRQVLKVGVVCAKFSRTVFFFSFSNLLVHHFGSTTIGLHVPHLIVNQLN